MHNSVYIMYNYMYCPETYNGNTHIRGNTTASVPYGGTLSKCKMCPPAERHATLYLCKHEGCCSRGPRFPNERKVKARHTMPTGQPLLNISLCGRVEECWAKGIFIPGVEVVDLSDWVRFSLHKHYLLIKEKEKKSNPGHAELVCTNQPLFLCFDPCRRLIYF